eukprot:3564017-Pyramimonas_sp.AAC.1
MQPVPNGNCVEIPIYIQGLNTRGLLPDLVTIQGGRPQTTLALPTTVQHVRRGKQGDGARCRRH